MKLAQELTEIYDTLRSQEIRIIELQRRLDAMLDVLKTQPHLFDSYQTTYKNLGGSGIVRRSEQAVLAINERLRRLAEEEQLTKE